AAKATDKLKKAADKAKIAQDKLKISQEKVAQSAAKTALAQSRAALAQQKLARSSDKAAKSHAQQRFATSGLTRTVGALRNKVLLATFAVAAISATVGKLTAASGDAQETISKFEAVFKDQAGAAKVFAEELAVSTNRATIELIDFLSTLQDTFVPLGFARDQASDLSKKLVTLAIDVASFNNKLDADVIRDFQSALVGNTETVRKYGIVITQATLGQELLNTGVADSVLKATEAEKAFARYNIILRSTTDAHGDAARTIESFNNTMVGARSAALELTIALGDRLRPAVKPLVSLFTQAAKGLTALLQPTDEVVKAQARLVEVNEAIFRIETKRLAGLFKFKLPGLKAEREELEGIIAASEKVVVKQKKLDKVAKNYVPTLKAVNIESAKFVGLANLEIASMDAFVRSIIRAIIQLEALRRAKIAAAAIGGLGGSLVGGGIVAGASLLGNLVGLSRV
ncbi:hypothetical protein LCGC14_2631780, partial [marine sediment metagenome]